MRGGRREGGRGGKGQGGEHVPPVIVHDPVAPLKSQPHEPPHEPPGRPAIRRGRSRRQNQNQRLRRKKYSMAVGATAQASNIANISR